MADFEQCFTFRCSAMDQDAFAVVDFHGLAELGRPYEYEINLVSQDPEIALDEVLASSCRFVIRPEILYARNPDWQSQHRREGDGDPSELVPSGTLTHGIVAEFDQQGSLHGLSHYRAVMRPRLWRLSLEKRTRIFLDRSIPEIIGDVLKDAGFEIPVDFDFLLERYKGEAESPDEMGFPRWEYLCQYQESSLDFLHRLMERMGLYYFFRQEQEAEQLVITNVSVQHPRCEPPVFRYAQDENLDLGPTVRELSCRQRRLPGVVNLRDYNYERPSSTIAGGAVVDEQGFGEIYSYGDHYTSSDECNVLSEILAEAYQCRKRTFAGESTAFFLTPGYLCDLIDHFRTEGPNFNQPYTLVRIRHEGSQAQLVLEAMGARSGEARALDYRNQFEAIPAKTQFRFLPLTEKPRFHGSISAHVDAAGSGDYAELDDFGRYKVRMPFDLESRDGGKASCWVRMISPYGGESMGMNFPLHKNTEVMLTFVDGDPDRPVIAGAVPNGANPSIVASGRETQAGFQTGGSNMLGINDEDGHQHMFLSAGDSSSLRIGQGSGKSLDGTSDAIGFLSTFFADVAGAGMKAGIGALNVKFTAAKWWGAILAELPKAAIDSAAKYWMTKGEEKLKAMDPKTEPEGWVNEKYSGADAEIKVEQEKETMKKKLCGLYQAGAKNFSSAQNWKIGAATTATSYTKEAVNVGKGLFTQTLYTTNDWSATSAGQLLLDFECHSALSVPDKPRGELDALVDLALANRGTYKTDITQDQDALLALSTKQSDQKAIRDAGATKLAQTKEAFGKYAEAELRWRYSNGLTYGDAKKGDDPDSKTLTGWKKKWKQDHGKATKTGDDSWTYVADADLSQEDMKNCTTWVQQQIDAQVASQKDAYRDELLKPILDQHVTDSWDTVRDKDYWKGQYYSDSDAAAKAKAWPKNSVYLSIPYTTLVMPVVQLGTTWLQTKIFARLAKDYLKKSLAQEKEAFEQLAKSKKAGIKLLSDGSFSMLDCSTKPGDTNDIAVYHPQGTWHGYSKNVNWVTAGQSGNFTITSGNIELNAGKEADLLTPKLSAKIVSSGLLPKTIHTVVADKDAIKFDLHEDKRKLYLQKDDPQFKWVGDAGDQFDVDAGKKICLEASDNIYVGKLDNSSAIVCMYGKETGMVATEGVTIISKKNVGFQSNDEFEVDAGGNLSLSSDKDLEGEGENVVIKGSTGAQVKGGDARLSLSARGAKVEFNGNEVKAEASGVTMQSSAQAKINGSIIQLG